MRSLLAAAAVTFVAGADPMDTVYDFLGALERADGYSMLDTFSESLEELLQTKYEALQQLAVEQPGVAGRVVERMLPGISAADLPGMSLGGFLSLLLLRLDPAGYDPYAITLEDIEMQGGNAGVLVGWDSGVTLSLDMVWEEGAWRINGSDLLGEVFGGL